MANMANAFPRTPYERKTKKRCCGCGDEKPLALFALTGKTYKGSGLRKFSSRCIQCKSPWVPRAGEPVGYVPVGPIRMWLTEQHEVYTWEELADMIGRPWKDTTRVLFRLANESKYRVRLDVVDKILTGFGVALWELYPDD